MSGTKMRLEPSGRLVDPLALEVDDVNIGDIARALSRQCRYNGHVAGFVSVARHSLWVSRLLEQRGCSRLTQLEGLLHDASEAYIGDMISPLKHRPELATFRAIEEDVDLVIALHFHTRHPLPPVVKEADRLVGKLEQIFWRDCWDIAPREDERTFLLRFNELIG